MILTIIAFVVLAAGLYMSFKVDDYKKKQDEETIRSLEVNL